MQLCLGGPLSGKSDKQKACYFLLYIGEAGRDVYNTWVIPNKVRINQNHCSPYSKSTVIQRKT